MIEVAIGFLVQHLIRLITRPPANKAILMRPQFTFHTQLVIAPNCFLSVMIKIWRSTRSSIPQLDLKRKVNIYTTKSQQLYKRINAF